MSSYIEIVSADVPSTVAMHEQVLGLAFSEADDDLGGARVASLPDGSLLGVRGSFAIVIDSGVQTGY